MNKQPLSLVLLSASLFLLSAPAFAQVDSIPDPRQDFYEQARPRRAPDFKKPAEIAPTPGKPVENPKAAPDRMGTTNKASGNDLDDAMSVPDNGPKPAPDRNGTETVDAPVPSNVPTVTHPELMPRPPIPTPPAVSLLQPMNGGQIKDPLSWRTRAYKLRSENPDAKTGLIKGSRLVNASFEDTISAVTSVCASKGLTIDSIYESAGQVLAHPSDSSPERSRIIISVKPITKTSTLVRIGLDSDNRSKQSSFDDLLNRVDAAINEKGLL